MRGVKTHTRDSRVGIGFMAIIVVAIIALNSFGLSSFIRMAFVPAEAQLRELAQLDNANSNISQREQELINEIASLLMLREENEALRKIIDFTKSNSHTYTAASVISYDPFVPTFAYLDVGSTHGVEVGQPVVAGEGILIGKIYSVTDATSKVELVISNSSRISAEALQHEKSYQGLLRGHLDTALLLEYIDHDSDLKPGDLIVTSGNEPKIPAGLVIGEVREQASSDSDLFNDVYVNSLYDLRSLRMVMIMDIL